MHIEQTLGNARKFIRDYYGNRLNTERLTIISPTRSDINTYVGYVKHLPVRKNTVLYEANFGRGMVDNPYALFREALRSDKYKNLNHYWVIDDPEDNPDIEEYRHVRNVHFVRYGSKKYLRALATCQYLINNSTFMPYFVKREGQVYINTWHGTPIKAMGFEMDGGIVGSANVIRNYLQTDYLLSANDKMTHMYLDSFKLHDIYRGKIIEEGYPRTDLNRSPRDVMYRKLEKAGIVLDHEKKVVLFAPTWRNSGSDNAKIDSTDGIEELIDFKRRLEEQLGSQYEVLVKPHNYLYELVKDDESYKGRIVPSTIDANELMSIVDIMVSDFSSIVFDFLPTKRPMVFYVPDYESYAATRGLTLDVATLPGPCIKSIDGVIEFIKQIDVEQPKYESKLEDCTKLFAPYDDGGVSARILDIVFGQSTEYRFFENSHEKQSILINGSSVRVNGLTRSLISLLKQMDYKKYDVTVFVGVDVNSPVEYLDEIPKEARVLVRIGAIDFTKYEDAIRATYDGFGKYNKVINDTYPRKAFHREAKRCFGNAEFDYAIDFNGYEQMITEIVVATNAKKKILWLHSVIESDMNREVNGIKPNYWHLNHVISMYPEFDYIVSCGKRVMEMNRDSFATDVTYNRFRYAKNTLDIPRIEKCLKESPVEIDGVEYYQVDNQKFALNLIELPKADRTTFINVGRLSSEKNQISIVRAFSRLHEEYPKTELFFVGGGPLMDQILAEAQERGVSEYVHVTDNVPNPFIFLSRADCFLLPSLHEGQPLVTLEARACGLPIITGNFSTVADSVIEGGQLVIDCDEQSIYEGMLSFMQGKVPTVEFDPYRYNREAIEEFEAAIS